MVKTEALTFASQLYNDGPQKQQNETKQWHQQTY
jgi:hypothetical protein